MAVKLQVGMLWYMGPPKTRPDLEEAITQAAEYYYNKHKNMPTLVHVNPKNQTQPPTADVGFIKVIDDDTILDGHLWIGKAGRE